MNEATTKVIQKRIATIDELIASKQRTLADYNEALNSLNLLIDALNQEKIDLSLDLAAAAIA